MNRAKHSVRSLGVQALLRIEEGAFAKETVESLQADCRPSDRGLLRELVYGVLENRTYLDFMIAPLSRRPLRTFQPAVQQAVRQGVYELHFLRTPAHAAIYETVEVVRQVAPRAVGLTNALLRQFTRRQSEVSVVSQSVGEDVYDRWAIRYSQPRWMIEAMESVVGAAALEALLQKNNEPAPLSLFVPPGHREEVAARLRARGHRVQESALSDHALLTWDGLDAEELAAGTFSVQSQGSLRAAEAVCAHRPARILDLCAAPGTKSVAMAHLAPEAELVVNDIDGSKRKRMEEGFARMHVRPLAMTFLDAAQFHPAWEGAFDAVLVDAPCSGLGLIRRKPDIRWKRTPEDVQTLAQLQRRILQQAIRYLAPGGRLVYSTCTYGKMENEDQAAWLRAQGLRAEPVDGEEERYFTPLEEDADGFYLIRLVAPRK